MSRSEGLAVVQEFADHFGITPAWILSGRRFAVLVRIRREVAIRLKEAGWHEREIAWFFGCDRTTVVHLVRSDERREERKQQQRAHYYAKAKPPQVVRA